MTPRPNPGSNVQPNQDGGPPSRPVEVYGAAPERTALAWQRTGLGVVLSSFLIFHTAFQLGVLAVGVLAGGLGLVVAGLSVFRFPARWFRRVLPADSWRMLVSVTASVVILGGLGAVTGALTLFR